MPVRNCRELNKIFALFEVNIAGFVDCDTQTVNNA